MTDIHEDIQTPSGRRPAPFSLRLTVAERAELERAAGRMSLSSYIKSRLFDEVPVKPRARHRRGIKDEKALAQLLAMLGSSRLSQNVNQLAKGMHTGNLPLPHDTAQRLDAACGDIQIMRLTLMRALGMPVGETKTKGRESVGQAFQRATTSDSPPF